MSEREVDPGSAGTTGGDVDHEELRVFWDLARFQARLNTMPGSFGPPTLEPVPPPGWTFGETPAEPDAVLAPGRPRRRRVEAVDRRERRLHAQPATEHGDGVLPAAAVAAVDVGMLEHDKVGGVVADGGGGEVEDG